MEAQDAARGLGGERREAVREDERFVREGDDLIAALDVAAPLAASSGVIMPRSIARTLFFSVQ